MQMANITHYWMLVNHMDSLLGPLYISGVESIVIRTIIGVEQWRVNSDSILDGGGGEQEQHE